MKFFVVTLFPEFFESFLSHSILWKAKEKELFSVEFIDLKNFLSKKFERVDDKAYGMHGQVMRPDILSEAIESVFQKEGEKPYVIYFSPRGKKLTQTRVEKFSQKHSSFLLICGHYEGIDERIIELYVDELVSIGDYVLSGWELPAQVFIDSLVRHIPWVLWNSQSLEEESFSKKLSRKKEYPVYTRPENFQWLWVPPILLSGNHREIEKWKQQNLSS